MRLRTGICMCVMIFMGIIDSFGCARLRVEGPKDPIKVDITMRVDVYQHVQNDIDAIEGIVSGEKTPGPQSLLSIFCSAAWAQDGLDPAVEDAALRRKNRLSLLQMLQSEGIVGESNQGILVVRAQAMITPDAQALLEEENKDRTIIYRAIAAKNNVEVIEIQKVYAERLQSDAPAGTPIETADGWQVK